MGIVHCDVADVAALSVDATRLLVTADLLALGRNFLLHAFGAHFDVQVLLEATSHRLERAHLLRVHRGVSGRITSPDQKLCRRERRGLLWRFLTWTLRATALADCCAIPVSFLLQDQILRAVPFERRVSE